MSEREFRAWIAFYRLYPFDDLHRFHRPAALVAAAYGGDYSRRLEFLAPEPVPEGMTVADLNTFKALGVKPPGRI